MWPFSKKPAPTQTERKEPIIARGFFSTDNVMSIPDKSEFIRANAFQKTAADFYVANGTTDDSVDNCNSLKGAFQLGQQNMNQSLLSWYVSQGFIGYQACALIFQNWLIAKACTQGARDACRKGYSVTVNNGDELSAELIDAIAQGDKKFKIKKNMEEFAKYNRVFGIRIALFEVSSTDPEYYTKPFNIDGVTAGSYKGISQVDPYWITPELDMVSTSDPSSRHFYEPTFWRIGGVRYHRSHLIISRYVEVPDVLKPSYIYGGIPLTQLIYERVYAAERTANEAPQLAMTKRTTTLHTDVEAALANQQEFEAKLQTWTYMRDNYGVKVLGTDETMEQFDTALSDLDAIIMTQYQLVSAVARVPATKLLGTSPKGFNATGGFEESSYHEELESIQSHEMQPLLERHHLLLMKSEIAPQFKIEPLETQVVWNKLDAPTTAEQAATNLVKAQTYQALQQTGAVDGEMILNVLVADPDSGFSGIEIPEEIDEPIIEEIPPTI